MTATRRTEVQEEISCRGSGCPRVFSFVPHEWGTKEGMNTALEGIGNGDYGWIPASA